MSKKRLSVVLAVVFVMALAVTNLAYAEPGEGSSAYMETLQSTFEGISEPVEELAEDEIEEVLRANGIAMRSLATASNFRELKNALGMPGVDVVMLLDDIQMEEPLEIITDRLTLLASSGVTVYSAPSVEHFYAYGDLYVTFFNVALDGNGDGGGLSFTGSGELFIEGASVQNSGSDRAIYIEGVQHTTLQDSFVWDNTGTGIFSDANLTVNNSIFTENGNGAIKVVGSQVDLEINGSIILENNASIQGGGIYAELGAGQLSLNGSTISDNRAVLGEGGGVYVRAQNVQLTGTVVENNKGAEGGGVFAAAGDAFGSSTVTVSGGRLEGNSALEGSGGGVYLDRGSLSLENTDVIGNYAYVQGGGLYLDQGSITANNTFLSENEATGVGGGICVIVGDYIVLDHSSIIGNKATLGGGICWGVERADLTDTRISGNEAVIGGGAFLNMGADVMFELAMNNSSIEDNVAQISGGGISLGMTSSPLGFRASGGTISGNTARDGGGIHYTTNFDGPVTFADMIIEGNTASTGGALYTNKLETVTIESDVIFSNNKADKGYLMTDAADIAIHETNVHTKSFSEPFTEYAYNNYDISYTKGTEARPVQVNFFLRASDGEPYYRTVALASQTLAGRFPDEPTYEGLVFAGWVDNNNVIYNEDTVITGDVDLHALWMLN